jgi:hypothetical protein
MRIHWRSFETETAGLAACNNQPVYLMSVIPNRKIEDGCSTRSVSASVFSAAVARMAQICITPDGRRPKGVAAESGGRARGRCAFQNNVIQCRLRYWGFSAGSGTGVQVWDDAPADGEPTESRFKFRAAGGPGWSVPQKSRTDGAVTRPMVRSHHLPGYTELRRWCLTPAPAAGVGPVTRARR